MIKRIKAKKVKEGDKIFLYGSWFTVFGIYASKNAECIIISLDDYEYVEVKSTRVIRVQREEVK